MTTLDGFFDGTRYALVGTDPRQPYGQAVLGALNNEARHAYVVFPEAAPSAGATRVYGSLREIDEPLDGAIFNIERDPQQLLGEVRTAVALGVRRIWIENRCDAQEAVAYARAHGAEVVDNVCPLIVLDPRHIHWLHRKVLDLLHKTPAVMAPTAIPESATSTVTARAVGS